MLNVRMTFKKELGAKYISHLDLTRVMARALTRAGIKVWYSEGFNPHPYMVFGPPLSVGFSAENEILEIKLISNTPLDKIKEDLNNTLPEGLSINEVYIAETPLKNIAFAEYKVMVETSQKEDLDNKLKSFFDKDSIMVVKRSKKTEKQIDLAKQIKKKEYRITPEGFELDLVLPCSNSENINPMLVITALKKDTGIEFDYVSVYRKGFLDCNLKMFT